MKTMLRTAVITAALALPLTACSASGASSFSTVEELKAAYVDAAAHAMNGMSATPLARGRSSKLEPSAAVLSTYSSKDDLNETLADQEQVPHNPRAFCSLTDHHDRCR